MSPEEFAGSIKTLCTPWPQSAQLRRSFALQTRLGRLPDSVSHVSLGALKAVGLPTVVDGEWRQFANRLSQARPTGGVVTASLIADAVPAIAPENDQALEQLLFAARALHALGAVDDAVSRLLTAARAARIQPERTFFALWLSEVAEAWLDSSANTALRAAVASELGQLVAATGDVVEGLNLLRGAAEGFFDLRSAEGTRAGWACRYDAARWPARINSAPEQTLRDLKTLTNERGLDGTVVWFHAGIEIIATEAGPGGHVRATIDAGDLLSRLEASTLSDADKAHLRAHADHALGHALSFGRNRSLHATAAEHFDEAIAHFRAARDWQSLAHALDGHGRILSRLGKHDRALPAFDESIALKQALKDVWGLGASLNGLAESLVRRGHPLEAIPLYDANLALLSKGLQSPTLVTVLQNLGLKARAFLAPYQNPLDPLQPESEHLRQAAEALAEYHERMVGQPGMAVSDAYHLMTSGILHRIEARADLDPTQALSRLDAGEALLVRSVQEFAHCHHKVALPNAELALAGVLVDRARLMPAGNPDRHEALDRARATLEGAEQAVWDTYERAYVDLEWAAYYQTLDQPSNAQRHVASARFHAEFCGNESIRLDLQPRLAVHLQGPTGDERCDVVVPPGETLAMEIRAVDWVGRPLPRYTLQTSVQSGHGSNPVAIAIAPEKTETDYLGKATFTVTAPADVTSGTALVQVEDRSGTRESRIVIHVRPFEIINAPGLDATVALDDDEQVVLRHLFGPRFHRVVIRKRFGGGKSGAKVLLVEPFLDPNDQNDWRGPSSLTTLRGQRCIVKIGERSAMIDEAKRYEAFVRDILPSNVSHFGGCTMWGGKAAIRMSLAGGQEWGRAEDEVDWLFNSRALAAHHLLEVVFAGDLASCWYSNGSASASRAPLRDHYGPMLPVLVTLRDAGVAEGLLTEPPDAMARSRLEDGLRPPGPERHYDRGDYVYLGALTITACTCAGREWKYELTDGRTGLRAAFRTPVPPEQMDPEGVAQHLIGQSRHVRGYVDELAFDKLRAALVNCVSEFSDAAGGAVSFGDSEQTLQVDVDGKFMRLPNPLLYLHEIVRVPVQCRRSIIHGDLHTRNIIIGSQGLPYYIDFGKTGVGPTLFDFIKHDVYLWLWSFARWPKGTVLSECSLANAVELMTHLARPANRHPFPFMVSSSLGDSQGWIARFYQSICTVRSLAQQYVISERSQDYFAPLCLYAALMLRWSDPAAATPEEKQFVAREGIIATLLAAMLLGNGMVDGVTL